MPDILPIILTSLLSICSIVGYSSGQIFDHVGRQRPFSNPQPPLPSPHQKLREHDELKYRRHFRENPQSDQPGLGKSIFDRDLSGGVGDRSRGAPNSRPLYRGTGQQQHETDDNYGDLFRDGRGRKVEGPRFSIFGPSRGQRAFAGGDFKEDLASYGVGRNPEDSDEEEDSSLRRKRIAMFDVLNLYSSLGTLCKAVGLLAARTWRRMETLLLALLFRGEEANRLSSIIVAWVVVATAVVLTALCVKRCCCDRSLYIELLEVDDGDDEEARRPRRRKSTIKRKRRINAATATSGERPKDPRSGGSGGGGEQRRFSQRLRDKNKKESERQKRQKRAARWVNLCLEAVYEDDAVRDIFLRKWMEALNRHVAEQQATESLPDLNLNFGEIFSSGLPRLSNFNVTADEGGHMLVTSSLEVSQFSLSLTSSRGRHVVSIESFQAVLFATVSPLDGDRDHVISLSMRSLSLGHDDSGGGGDDDDDDEFGPNHSVCVTSSSSSSRPEDTTDQLVRRLAMDAVWCTQLRIDPQNDLGVQTFDEKSDLCPVPAPLSSFRSQLDVLSVTLVRTSGLHSASLPYVTLELLSPPLSAISAAGIGRQKRETVKPPAMSRMVTDQLQSCTLATWNQQFQFLISPPSAIMGLDEQLLLNVWDESAGWEECDEKDHDDGRGEEGDDDDEDYFVGSWAFNVEELRQPCSQRHVVALHHEQNEHDQQNKWHNETFTNKAAVIPETIMTVKFSYTSAPWDLQHYLPPASNTLANGSEVSPPYSDPLSVHKSFESRRTHTSENEIESTTVATYVPMVGGSGTSGKEHKRASSNEVSGSDPWSERVSPIPMRQFSAPEACAENAFIKICVADAALRDLYRHRIQGGTNPTRSTLLIRSFQKFPSQCPRIEVERTVAGDCGGHSEDKSSDLPDYNTSSPSSGCSKTLTLPEDDSRRKRRHRFISRVRRKFKKKMTEDKTRDKSDISCDNPSPAQSLAGNNNNNYAKVSGRQRETSPASHTMIDRKSRNQESSDDETGSGSESVIGTKYLSPSKVSRDCNICNSDCSDCSDEIEADLDPSTWNGRLSVSWQSLDKVAPRLLLDPTADATSLSELSTSSVAVTPLPAPKIDARKKTAAAAARLARPEAESNLILETTECGLRRHYLIPRHLQKAARRKRSEREKTSSSASAASLLSKHLIKSLKGTKLHLAMEHIFVATNVKSGATCDICSRKIARRFALGNKQGYVCRGCDVTCHKGCHARVEDLCTSSEFSQMELLRGSSILTR